MKLKFIQFTPEQLARLEAGLLNEKTAHRAKALLCLTTRLRINEVCKENFCTYVTLNHWVAEFINHDSLGESPSTRLITPEVVDRVLALYYGPPPKGNAAWKYRTLCESWNKNNSPRLSQISLRDIIINNPGRLPFHERARHFIEWLADHPEVIEYDHRAYVSQTIEDFKNGTA